MESHLSSPPVIYREPAAGKCTRLLYLAKLREVDRKAKLCGSAGQSGGRDSGASGVSGCLLRQ